MRGKNVHSNFYGIWLGSVTFVSSCLWIGWTSPGCATGSERDDRGPESEGPGHARLIQLTVHRRDNQAEPCSTKPNCFADWSCMDIKSVSNPNDIDSILYRFKQWTVKHIPGNNEPNPEILKNIFYAFKFGSAKFKFNQSISRFNFVCQDILIISLSLF